MIGCAIQKHHSFPKLAESFAADKNIPELEQRHPMMEKTRAEECPKCPASTGYNHGLGIDCWFSIPLPIKPDIYDFIYERLTKGIKPYLGDLEKAKNLDRAFGELQVSSNSVIGGLQNNWLTNDEKRLSRSVKFSTQKADYDISVASVIGYIVKDSKSPIIHSDILSLIFDKNSAASLDPSSPVQVWKYIFYLSKNINIPIQVRIVKNKDFYN